MKNKIIFWLNADFTIFAIARELQKKYDGDFYAIIDITNKPKEFFINQKLVKFKKTWFFHDNINPNKKPDLEYLKSFEEKYKINLWILAYNERLFYNFNEYYQFSLDQVLSILEQECRLFESMIDEVRPSFLIMFNTMSHYDHLFYEICKRKSVTPLILNDARLGRRWTVSSIPDNFDFLPDSFEGKTEFKTLEQLQSLREKFDMYKTVNDMESKFLKSKTKMLFAAIKFLFFNDNAHIKTHFPYFGRTKIKVLLKSLKYYLIEPYRLHFINKNFLHKIPNEKFIYFALPAEPERTVLLAAPFYTNQLDVVSNIVKSLPFGYKLYVKEHPAMNSRGWRKISYYKQLIKMPNVKLVHPQVKSEDIIKKSSLVIAISGTAGFEASFFNKPSIVFTDTNYSILSNVIRLKSVEELPEAIRISLTKKINHLELGEYVDTILANTCEFDMYSYKSDFSNQFYYRSFLVDVPILEEDLKLFLDNHNNMINSVVDEFLKKLNTIKEKSTKHG